MEYVSTNVRLPKELLKSLKLKAVEEEKSMGEVLRNILERGLSLRHRSHRQKKSKKNSPLPKNHPWKSIVALGASGITDGAVNHDYYLYGYPKKEPK